ncbi:MAG: PP2C family protein-serine/threonine phosphatase, partial [Pseudomonadota bacterium]
IVVRNNGDIEQIDTIDLGFILGVVPDISEFIEYFEIQLDPEDCLVLYTDGITEAFNDNQQFYGVERLCEVVKANRHGNADAIKQAVIDDVFQHAGQESFKDDITLVTIKQLPIVN